MQGAACVGWGPGTVPPAGLLARAPAVRVSGPHRAETYVRTWSAFPSPSLGVLTQRLRPWRHQARRRGGRDGPWGSRLEGRAGEAVLGCRRSAHPPLLWEGLPAASRLQTPGPLSRGSLPAGGQGTPGRVPMEGASSPPGPLIQATGSCAVALRQLFLAPRIPAQKPVPTAGRSSSPGAPPGSGPPPTPFPCGVWGPRQAEVWLEGGCTWQGWSLQASVPDTASLRGQFPRPQRLPAGTTPEPRAMRRSCGQRARGRERNGAGGRLHFQTVTPLGEAAGPQGTCACCHQVADGVSTRHWLSEAVARSHGDGAEDRALFPSCTLRKPRLKLFIKELSGDVSTFPNSTVFSSGHNERELWACAPALRLREQGSGALPP